MDHGSRSEHTGSTPASDSSSSGEPWRWRFQPGEQQQLARYGGFLKWGYIHLWMVYFMDNSQSKIRMMKWATPILGNPHILKEIERNFTELAFKKLMKFQCTDVGQFSGRQRICQGLVNVPILGILNITFEYLLEIIASYSLKSFKWCSIRTFTNPCLTGIRRSIV